MIPEPFEYRSPESIEEAIALLARYREDARVLSGGHSLVPAMKLRLAAPAVVVDLRRIPGLGEIASDGEGVSIGARVTHHEVETSPLVRARCPLLAETAGCIGDVQVRNFGTLVGSLCHADPASDYPAALLALDAGVVIAGPRGPRQVPAADFLQGILETALEPDEMVEGVRLPRSFPGTAAYVKMRQSASGFAIAGVAAQLVLEGPVLRSVAIGVTGIAARAFRASAAEDELRGKELVPDTVDRAIRGLASGREVLSDLHASAEYRSHLVDVLARRAVLLAASRC